MFSNPNGPPRNERLARFVLNVPRRVPPYVVKAFPRKGWVLLSDGTTDVLVCIGPQHFGKNESRRVHTWCNHRRVAYVCTVGDDNGLVFYPQRPSLWTRWRWRWLHLWAKTKTKKHDVYEGRLRTAPPHQPTATEPEKFRENGVDPSHEAVPKRFTR
jgi:hypothetical protein